MSLKRLKKTIYCWIVFFAVFGVVNITSAGVAPIAGIDCVLWGIINCDVNPTANVLNYLWSGLQAVLSFASVIAAAALVYYGILYITSRGEEDKARQAKTGIVYALGGLLFIGFAAWIVNAIINISPP